SLSRTRSACSPTCQPSNHIRSGLERELISGPTSRLAAVNSIGANAVTPCAKAAEEITMTPTLSSLQYRAANLCRFFGLACLALDCFSATAAVAADPQQCAKYANLAMKDFVYANGRCKMQRDATWQPDYGYHYNRCLAAPDSELAQEANKRAAVLIDCGLIN